MSKHVYFIPGTAANSKIFEGIKLPSKDFQAHYLEWMLPLDKTEPLDRYAKRFSEKIKHKNPILVGVSFGGILAQEVSKVLKVEQVVLISSIKKTSEMSFFLRFVKVTGIYKLFPSTKAKVIEKWIPLVFGDTSKRSKNRYKAYLSFNDPLYLDWAIYNSLHWQQKEGLKNVVHIHGDKDPIFPIRKIKDCKVVKNGSHVMVLTHAKKISTILAEILCKP